MSHEVYICYARKDIAVAHLVVNQLEKKGIHCWVDYKDIKPSTDWLSEIYEAVESSKVVVIIFSENVNNSGTVAREVELAVTNGLDIIPFRVEEINPSDRLSYFLRSTHWIDAFPQPIEEHLDRLVETIRVYLGIEAAAERDDALKTKEKAHQTGQGKKDGLLKRLFNKKGGDGKGLTSEKTEFPKLKPTENNARLKVIDSLDVQGGISESVIQFCIGDVTKASPEHAVDVLVTSAFRDQYYPVPGSVFGSLFRRGLSVEELANNKEVDLRGAFSCWLSKEIIDPPEGIQFKRLLCYEPSDSAKAGEQIGDIFRSLAPFIGGQDPIRTVATTLVAAGSSRRITQRESLQLLVEAAVQWMSSGLPIEQFNIICLPNQDIEVLTQLFSELKSKFEKTISPQRQDQFSYDFFISYSHQDMREIDIFVDLLTAQKQDLRIFIDKHNLDPGSAWQREIYEAIDDCRKVATFYSPTYLESKVCLEEFNIALCRHRESEQPVLKPIYLYSANLPTYMKLIQFFDCRESNRGKLKQAADDLLQGLP